MAINTIAYLDDFGFSLSRRTPPHVRQHAIWTVMAIMYLAGYTVSVGKSNLQPSRTLELLGFGIDTKRELFYVLQRKCGRTPVAHRGNGRLRTNLPTQRISPASPANSREGAVHVHGTSPHLHPPEVLHCQSGLLQPPLCENITSSG